MAQDNLESPRVRFELLQPIQWVPVTPSSSRKATLTALYVVPEPRITALPIGLGPVPPSAVAWTPPAVAGSPREPERADEAETLFRSELRSAGLDGEWYLLDERDLVGLIEFANTVDLAILGQQAPGALDHSGSLLADRVITEVGRPVLIVPYWGRFETVGRRALIAWDGSREAARALNDALPLIEGAEAVTVLYIGTGEAQLERARPALSRVVRHLQRHALKTSGEETPRGDVAISDLLLSRAADLGADMIIAGAYPPPTRARASPLSGTEGSVVCGCVRPARSS